MKRIYRDRHRRLRASARAFPPLLADFLETDVRENRSWCQHLLSGIAQARAGSPFEAGGNVYVLAGDGAAAEIRNAEDDDAAPLRLGPDTLEDTLTAWAAAMRRPDAGGN